MSEKDVLDLLERILVSPYTNTTIRQFVLTALAKLSTRFSHPESFARITKTMHGFDASVELELQQRAIEFGKLLTLDSIRGGVLERMPPPELKPTVMGTGQFAHLFLTLSPSFPWSRLNERLPELTMTTRFMPRTQ